MNFRWSEYCALALGAASGSLVFGALPIAVGAAVSVFGGATQGGIAAALELGAMGASSVFISARVRVLRGRSTAIVTALLLVLGHATSALAVAEPHWLGFLVARVLVGLGEGGLYTICNTFAAKSPRPDRTYTGIAFAQTALMALFFTTMGIVNGNYDPVRVFVVFAAFAAIVAIPLLGAPNYRLSDDSEDGTVAARTPFSPRVRQVLAGFAVFSVALFMLFPYVQAVGLANGFTYAQIATILGASAVASLLGPIITALIGLRFGRLVPVFTAIGFQIGTCLVLVYSSNLLLWGGAELTSIFLLYVLNPLMFGLVAHIEPSGRANAVATAIMSLMAAIGPAVSSAITSFTNSYVALGWCNAIAYVIMAAILWGPQLAVDREAKRPARSAAKPAGV